MRAFLIASDRLIHAADCRRSLLVAMKAGGKTSAFAMVFVALALAGTSAVARPALGSLPPPVSPTCITSPFGPRLLANRPLAGTFHYGIDLRAPLGTAVRAVAAGQVIGIDRRGAGGLEVRVRHDGFTALYAHLGLLAPALLRGQRSLAADEKIAVVGASGLTYGPHLYFELSIDGHRVDPAPYLQTMPCQ
jgi:murein DD-endopeptidase MepM/ murein hydrolase activator NlpD